MEISVEYHPGEVQVIVRGPEDSEELLRILSLLRGEQDKLWGWDEHRNGEMTIGWQFVGGRWYYMGGNGGKQGLCIHRKGNVSNYFGIE
mgnify:CR=1 FL=1